MILPLMLSAWLWDTNAEPDMSHYLMEIKQVKATPQVCYIIDPIDGEFQYPCFTYEVKPWAVIDSVPHDPDIGTQVWMSQIPEPALNSMNALRVLAVDTADNVSDGPWPDP